jgi:ribosomal protein L11 methyltransferase
VTDWIQITASFDKQPADWSVYADAFDRFGCPGSLQTDKPAAISAYLVAVDGARAQAAGLAQELRRLGACDVRQTIVPDEDWTETWKQFFKPRRVGRLFVVRPSWEEFAAGPDDHVIVLDPGEAFGTGDHQTTRLCLELMEDAGLAGREVADMGCGSGILSIGACLLEARRVFAVDIDPISVEVARENAERNGVAFECVCGDGFEPLGAETYDVILSNIISAVLIRLAPQFALHVRPGGLWIASGIILQNWPDVLAAAERAGFSLVDLKQEDEWVGATLRR